MSKINRKEKVKVLKYRTNKTSMFLIGIISFILVIGYIFCLYNENSLTLEMLNNKDLSIDDIALKRATINIINIVASLLVVCFSVFLSAIFSSLMIKKDQNHLYSDLITNDVFASDDFYLSLDDSNQQKVLKNLEQHIYFNDKKPLSDMYLFVRNRLSEPFEGGDYYYNKCSYNVSCDIFENYIHKDITKTFHILPISKEQKRLKEFFVASSTFEEKALYEPLKINYIKINGKEVADKEYHFSEHEITALDEKSGYTKCKEVYCSHNIDLSSKTPVIVEINYETNVPKNDTNYACRLNHPCKNFSFTFSNHIKDNNKYKLVPTAFGFVEDGKECSTTKNDDQVIHLEIDKWMFACDGVCISICKI